jgi:hypothetical protein
LDIQAVYRVRSDTRSIAERARMIALEPNVEMPPETIDDPFVHNEIVGRVLDIKDNGAPSIRGGVFDVRIALATVTTAAMPGVRDVVTHDLIAVPPMTWHQFRAMGRSRSAPLHG